MRSLRRLAAAAGLVVAIPALLAAVGDTPARPARIDIRLQDLSGQMVNPLQDAPSTKATVVLFVSVDCPVSNRYAPEVIRLHDRFAAQGVTFWIVYPNPAETAATITNHLKDYRYPARALRDPRHEFVKAAGISMTPEAAVFDRDGRMVYRGRIDDRYVNIGLERPQPTRRDLEEVLTAVASGTHVTPRMTQAVGCYVADFLP